MACAVRVHGVQEDVGQGACAPSYLITPDYSSVMCQYWHIALMHLPSGQVQGLNMLYKEWFFELPPVAAAISA